MSFVKFDIRETFVYDVGYNLGCVAYIKYLYLYSSFFALYGSSNYLVLLFLSFSILRVTFFNFFINFFCIIIIVT